MEEYQTVVAGRTRYCPNCPVGVRISVNRIEETDHKRTDMNAANVRRSGKTRLAVFDTGLPIQIA